jgi:hypothetical protein
MRPSTEHENKPLWSAYVAPSDMWARGVRRVYRVVLKRCIVLVTIGVQRSILNQEHMAVIERGWLRSARRWPRPLSR